MAGNKNWSGEVTAHSNALDLEEGVFTWDDSDQIARSLLHSAEASERRKAPPFQSAMSMLNFYINRAGKSLLAHRRKILNQAKVAFRRLAGQQKRLPASPALCPLGGLCRRPQFCDRCSQLIPVRIMTRYESLPGRPRVHAPR